jgi:hypothetical protein
MESGKATQGLIFVCKSAPASDEAVIDSDSASSAFGRIGFALRIFENDFALRGSRPN